MKVYYVIEIIFSFIILTLINIYFVSMDLFIAIIVAGISTAFLSVAMYQMFIKKSLKRSKN